MEREHVTFVALKRPLFEQIREITTPQKTREPLKNVK
jgi:hypothetical protein